MPDIRLKITIGEEPFILTVEDGEALIRKETEHAYERHRSSSMVVSIPHGLMTLTKTLGIRVELDSP